MTVDLSVRVFRKAEQGQSVAEQSSSKNIASKVGVEPLLSVPHCCYRHDDIQTSVKSNKDPFQKKNEHIIVMMRVESWLRLHHYMCYAMKPLACILVMQRLRSDLLEANQFLRYHTALLVCSHMANKHALKTCVCLVCILLLCNECMYCASLEFLRLAVANCHFASIFSSLSTRIADMPRKGL